MTDKIEDGGPAFPHLHAYTMLSRDGFGMSLRDWFAGMALPKMIDLSQDRDGGWSTENVTNGCYNLADAMLAVRAKS